MSSVLISATQQMLRETGESCSFFATERLIPSLEVQGLINTTPSHVTAGEYLRWRQRCIKRAQRVLAGDTPMPADWVVTWLAQLSQPYRDKCAQKLAALQGLMQMPLPQRNHARVNAVRAEIDTITQRFGAVLASAAPAHDGVYDKTDCRRELRLLQNRLLDLYQQIGREMANIEAATGIIPDSFTLSSRSPLCQQGGTNVAV